MRSLFATAPEKISPDFSIVRNEDDLRNFAASHSFPLILKPANLAKSLLVTKNNSLDELIASYNKSCDLLESIYKKYAPNRTPTLIIEEFLEGSVHSVDAFIDADGIPHVLEQVVDYQTGYDIGYDDNFHYSRLMPSKLSADDQATLRHCADVGARALGMKSSPAHIEVIVTNNGPRIVEIGARNGGYRERMHDLANDLDLIELSVKVALGQPIHVTATKENPVAVLELFPKTPGEFVELSNEVTLRSLPSLRYLSVKPKAGSFVGKSSDGHKACAVIILHNSDSEQFQHDLDYINASVAVMTR
jgi:biotin carboxylase